MLVVHSLSRCAVSSGLGIQAVIDRNAVESIHRVDADVGPSINSLRSSTNTRVLRRNVDPVHSAMLSAYVRTFAFSLRHLIMEY